MKAQERVGAGALVLSREINNSKCNLILNKFKLETQRRSFGRSFHVIGSTTLVENLQECVRANACLMEKSFRKVSSIVGKNDG